MSVNPQTKVGRQRGFDMAKMVGLSRATILPA